MHGSVKTVNNPEKEMLEINSLSEKKVKRKTAEILKCPHPNQKHYAKGMCNHCYHKYGRKSNADACPHTDRLVYAKGKCQNCYLNDYNKVKRKMKKVNGGNITNQADIESSNSDNLDFEQINEPESKKLKK